VWKKAHALTLQLYVLTDDFPKKELFGLTSQIRRAAASIGANLAEGCGRRTDGEMARFVRIAMGSASELDYHLVLASDLALINKSVYPELDSKLSEVRRMLTGFLDTLESEAPARARSAAKC
jgi:four helix bundle protein